MCGSVLSHQQRVDNRLAKQTHTQKNMNPTYSLAMLDRLSRELKLRAYVESGRAEADLQQAWKSVAAFETAFAEYEKHHGKKG